MEGAGRGGVQGGVGDGAYYCQGGVRVGVHYGFGVGHALQRRGIAAAGAEGEEDGGCYGVEKGFHRGGWQFIR